MALKCHDVPLCGEARDTIAAEHNLESISHGWTIWAYLANIRIYV